MRTKVASLRHPVGSKCCSATSKKAETCVCGGVLPSGKRRILHV
ncbi:MAG: hypothetical protein Q8P67_04320 [archaeon]|nr:hypothetical protein [archaeon]